MPSSILWSAFTRSILQRLRPPAAKFYSSQSGNGGIGHPLFNRKSLREDVWIIEEKFFISWNRANVFFIKGSNADLLVDTGTSVTIFEVYLPKIIGDYGYVKRRPSVQ
jgi:hypothetical protein